MSLVDISDCYKQPGWHKPLQKSVPYWEKSTHFIEEVCYHNVRLVFARTVFVFFGPLISGPWHNYKCRHHLMGGHIHLFYFYFTLPLRNMIVLKKLIFIWVFPRWRSYEKVLFILSWICIPDCPWRCGGTGRLALNNPGPSRSGWEEWEVSQASPRSPLTFPSRVTPTSCEHM